MDYFPDLELLLGEQDCQETDHLTAVWEAILNHLHHTAVPLIYAPLIDMPPIDI